MRIIFSELPGNNLTGKGGRGRLHRRTVPKQLHGTTKFPRSPCVGSLCCSVAVRSDSVTPWTALCQDSPSLSISRSLLKFMSLESVMLSNHLVLCHPLLCLPSIFPSINIFSSESALRIRWPKFWRFSFSISPFNEYSELISFRIDWLDLLAVPGGSQESSPTP